MPRRGIAFRQTAEVHQRYWLCLWGVARQIFVHLLLSLFTGISVAFLQFTDQLVLLAFDANQIVIGKLLHCCLMLPFNCFQLPLRISEFISTLFSFSMHTNVEVVRRRHHAVLASCSSGASHAVTLTYAAGRDARCCTISLAIIRQPSMHTGIESGHTKRYKLDILFVDAHSLREAGRWTSRPLWAAIPRRPATVSRCPDLCPNLYPVSHSYLWKTPASLAKVVRAVTFDAAFCVNKDRKSTGDG